MKSIQEFLDAEGLRPVDLARLCGVSKTTISKRQSYGWCVGYVVLDGCKRLAFKDNKGRTIVEGA